MTGNLMPDVPTIKLGGAEISEELAEGLVSVTVERGLRRPSSAEIVIQDDDFDLLTDQASSFAPGTEVSISFAGDNAQDKTVFTGTVTGLRVSRQRKPSASPKRRRPASPASDGLADQDDDWHEDESEEHPRTVFTLVAHDAAHGLDTVGTTVSSTNATLRAALQTALSSYFTDTISISGLPATQRDSVIVACSPMELLEQLCDRYGVEWWVDPADKSMNVDAAPSSPNSTSLDLGEELLDIDFRAAGKTTGTVSMRGWDPAAKEKITGTNPAPQPASSLPTLLKGATGFAQADSAYEYQARPFSTVDAADLTAQATAHAKRLARSGTVLTARTLSIVPEIGPRDDLVLTGAGPLAGNHPVVAVRHDWGSVTTTTVIAGDRALAPLPVPGPSPAETSFSPPARPFQAVGGTYGLLPGLVTDIQDPKSWGRVKVKLPTLGDDVQTGWARTVLSSAGSKRGMVVPHRVDDEVLVGFEEGDLQRAVVLGALHNGKDAAPIATSGRDTDLSAGLTSANGHHVVLTDAGAPGTNAIDIKHAAQHQILLAGDQVLVKAEAGTPLKLQSGQASITLDASGHVEIKGVKVSVTGGSSVTVGAPETKIMGDLELELASTVSTTVKGATLAINADAAATIKGATVAIN